MLVIELMIIDGCTHNWGLGHLITRVKWHLTRAAIWSHEYRGHLVGQVVWSSKERCWLILIVLNVWVVRRRNHVVYLALIATSKWVFYSLSVTIVSERG